MGEFRVFGKLNLTYTPEHSPDKNNVMWYIIFYIQYRVEVVSHNIGFLRKPVSKPVQIEKSYVYIMLRRLRRRETKIEQPSIIIAIFFV